MLKSFQHILTILSKLLHPIGALQILANVTPIYILINIQEELNPTRKNAKNAFFITMYATSWHGKKRSDMEDLRFYEGKNVKLVHTEGDVFEGYVTDYIFPEDNVPIEIEAIIIKNPIRNGNYRYSAYVEFTIAEIKSIEVVE